MNAAQGCSVVIPTHNRAHLIGRAVRSVLDQAHAPLEVIVVDDGSTDGTEQAVTAFPAETVRYLRNDTNLGAAASRNRGANEARFPLLTFLDSDDEARPGWLESMTRALLQTGVGAACCGLQQYSADGRLIATGMPRDMGPSFDHTVARFTHGGVFMLPRALFLEVGGYDATLPSGQHTELSMRVIPLLRERGLRIENLFVPLVRINIHKGARIRTNWNALFAGSLAALSKHPQLFAKDPNLTANYLSIAGISRARVGQFDQAQRYLREALRADPRRPARWGRLLMAHLPWIREQVWRP